MIGLNTWYHPPVWDGTPLSLRWWGAMVLVTPQGYHHGATGFWTGFDIWSLIALVSLIIGISALIISIATRTHGQAKIVIDNLMLETALVNWEELLSRYIKQAKGGQGFYLNLFLDARNGGAGAGSISKPILVIRGKGNSITPGACLPDRQGVAPRGTEVRLSPMTMHVKSGSDVTYECIETGDNIYLKGGEKISERLEYYLKGEQYLRLVAGWRSPQYFVAYTDNNGQSHQRQIEGIISKNVSRK